MKLHAQFDKSNWENEDLLTVSISPKTSFVTRCMKKELRGKGQFNYSYNGGLVDLFDNMIALENIKFILKKSINFVL